MLTSPPTNGVVLDESGDDSADDDEAGHERDTASDASRAQPAQPALAHVDAVDDAVDAAPPEAAHPAQHDYLRPSAAAADHTYCAAAPAPAPPAMTEVRFQNYLPP